MTVLVGIGADGLTFTCANCALDYELPFCDFCGASLIPPKHEGGAEALAGQAAPPHERKAIND